MLKLVVAGKAQCQAGTHRFIPTRCQSSFSRYLPLKTRWSEKAGQTQPLCGTETRFPIPYRSVKKVYLPWEFKLSWESAAAYKQDVWVEHNSPITRVWIVHAFLLC